MVTHLIILYIKLGIGNPIFAAVDFKKLYLYIGIEELCHDHFFQKQ